MAAPTPSAFPLFVKPAQATAKFVQKPTRPTKEGRIQSLQFQSMGAGKGGDEDAAAAAPEAAQPVVLKMALHCAGCAKKVTKAIKRMPGVESVVADAATNMVVVAGNADAAALKARLEAKTNKAVEVVSAGGGGPKKEAGAGEKKQADKDGGAGETKGDKDASSKEEKEKEKKQLQAEEKPKEDTVVLKIPLHCAGCADRIRRRIYKTKKDVVLEGNAKDEVRVTGTMDVPAMLSYLREKLKRPVEAVAPAKKDGGGEGKEKIRDADDASKGAAADKTKDASSAGGADKRKDKGKSIDAAGPSTVAAAAAFMAAPSAASTYHVTPPYAYAAYPQQGTPASASSYSYPYYGNADGMGYAYPSQHQATYQQQPQYHPYPDHDHDASQHQAAAYQPYPYRMDMSPPTQLFSDENPNACSVM